MLYLYYRYCILHLKLLKLCCHRKIPSLSRWISLLHHHRQVYDEWYRPDLRSRKLGRHEHRIFLLVQDLLLFPYHILSRWSSDLGNLPRFLVWIRFLTYTCKGRTKSCSSQWKVYVLVVLPFSRHLHNLTRRNIHQHVLQPWIFQRSWSCRLSRFPGYWQWIYLLMLRYARLRLCSPWNWSSLRRLR